MSTPKKSVDTAVAAIRLWGETTAADEKSLVDRWLTPEFWATAATVVTNALSVLVLIGWVDSSAAETLTKSVTALVGAVEVILINSVLIWKYIAGRNALKAKFLESKYRYLEMLAMKEAAH